MPSNSRKSEILGMPIGSAASKLRKNILFSVLKKHGENNCYKCSMVIESVDDLSIEHKVPWQSRNSAELFWDLDNIAFSHAKCNLAEPHTKNRKIGPDGTAWCSDHKGFSPVGKFHVSNGRWNKLSYICKDCSSKRRTKQ